MIQPINSKNGPAAVGPYSQAVVTDDFIFCSGQIGIDPSTGTMAEGMEAQTKQILKNISAVLEDAGTTVNQVVKTTVFLTNMANFATMNELYAAHFGDHKPARSTIGVAELPKGALVEIEVIASKLS